jgi:hypothetical protein
MYRSRGERIEERGEKREETVCREERGKESGEIIERVKNGERTE